MVRDSKQSLSIANTDAFTLTYTGTGVATAAVASNTLTITRANANAFTLTYTGSAATCTVAQDSDTLTIARTAENAFTLTYTGEEETATVAVAANTLTYVIGTAEPVSYDLTNESYNTIAKVVAALDAVDGLTCTLATGAVNTNTGTTLNNLTATSIKTALALKYTPANLTWDLTNASYNTLAEIIAALEALDLYTCTLATGAIGTDNSALLDTLEAASIKTAKTLKYSYADLTYDLTNASYDTLSELIAALDAVADLTCTAVTTHTGNSSILLADFEAASINTALTPVMSQVKFTASYNDIGEPIGVKGWDSLALYVKVDINDTQNARLRFYGKTEVADTDLFLMDHNRIKCPNATVPATENYIELDSDADQLVEVIIPELYGIEAVQVQISAGTAGASPGTITSIEYMRTMEG